MKRKRRITVLMVITLLATAQRLYAQSGGSVNLSWHVLGSAGTTTSSGGDVMLSGTLGQFAPGPASGDAVTLQAGFWQEEGIPTAVVVARFEAEQAAGCILLIWETASEINIAGFNLYHSGAPEGDYIRLNGELIPSQAPGSLQGAVYDWQDEEVELGRTYYYKLEVLDNQGGRTWHGPIPATVPARAAYSVHLPLVTK